MFHSKRVEDAARQRILSRREEISRSLRMEMEGRPRAAEREKARLTGRLMVEQDLSRVEAENRANILTRKPKGAEVIQGDTVDFSGVYFFDQGRRASHSVMRVKTRTGFGTGFMVSPTLMVTNHHVIASAQAALQSEIQFDFEELEDGGMMTPTVFALDPQRFFCTDVEEGLDFALIAVGAKKSGPRNLQDYGYCSLSDAENKHSLGEMANVIQHPEGKPKQVVLRENRLVARTESMLHYVADTMPGSSGSPVFNSEWQVIAIHHYGGPSIDGMLDEDGLPVPQSVNEGVRASAIVGFLKDKVRDKVFTAEQVKLLRDGFNMPRWGGRGSVSQMGGESSSNLQSTASHDGTMTWRIPLEISVRLPFLNPSSAGSPPSIAPLTGASDAAPDAEAFSPDQDYGKRDGYDPTFIGKHKVEMPKLSKAQAKDAARNIEAKKGDDPFELKYLHYSVVMNGKRRLAFFTACSIDGANAKHITRSTGAIRPARPGDKEAMDRAEGGEKWFTDPRIGEDEQTPQDLYDSQKTPKGAKGGHIANIFQRGHLVRRMDPAWGPDKVALAADADTFHFTNCTPQIGFFNMGKGDRGVAGTGNGKLWRALEDYVLDNAIEEGKRIAVFTGPVFDAKKDIPWREHVIEGFRVPLKFWKVVVWEEQGDLRARAMIADQKIVTPKNLPEGMAEEFANTVEVDDFLTSIKEIEALTGLSFPANVKAADVGKGSKVEQVKTEEEVRTALKAAKKSATKKVPKKK